MIIGNAVLAFVRHTTRHPRYALLNLVGLSSGIAMLITLGLYVRDKTGTQQHHTNRDHVAAVGLVGLLAFGITLINYVTLATARSGLRAREVAVRKTLGASVTSLRLQFLCESCLSSILAGIIGISIVELALPQVNSLAGLHLGLDYIREWRLWTALIAAVLAAGLLAGLYPAFMLSAVKPAQVLASSRAPPGGRLGRRIRAMLVAAQFGVVVICFVMVAGFAHQIAFMKSADIGDRRHGLLLLLGIGALVAAMIGCIGLYGLAAFTTAMRSREIGLRKLLGASRGKVFKLLLRQFLQPVLSANLLAWPLGYWILSHWLNQFDEHIALNPLHFLLPSAVATIIALVTVGGLAYGGASTEPGKALRYE